MFHVANVKGLKIDVSRLIHAQVLEFVMPSKGSWFSILMTKIFKKAGVKMGWEEEYVKPDMPITTKMFDERWVILGTKAIVDGRATLHVSSAHESKGAS